jgi:hypothetical protein
MSPGEFFGFITLHGFGGKLFTRQIPDHGLNHKLLFGKLECHLSSRKCLNKKQMPKLPKMPKIMVSLRSVDFKNLKR